MATTLTVKIEDCARCGQTHEHVFFQPFIRVPIFDGLPWGYWGMCPVTAEPILMRSRPLRDEEIALKEEK